MAGLLLVVVGVVSPAAKADPCATVNALRTMAADHFRSQRGEVQGDGDRFRSRYKMDGAKSCEIAVYGPGHSVLTCEWFLQTTLVCCPADT